jgi:ABC-type uncharacterized transport system involved in gliding motility auxiliary subunit
MVAKSGRKLKWAYGTNTVISSLIFFVILVFVVLIAQQNPLRVDLTDNGVFTLSQQTKNILKTIKKPVTIKVFIATTGSGAEDRGKIKDLLKSYTYLNKDIKFQMIDPATHPQMTKSYGVKTYGTLVLEGYGKKQLVQGPDEQSVTNALLKLQSKVQQKVYFLSGHGEHSLTVNGNDSFSVAREALEKDFYKIGTLNLVEQGDVPADAAAVIIAGPQKPILPQEQKILAAYLARGGSVFLMLDPLTQTGMTNFVKDYGIDLGNDMVVDRLSRLFGVSPTIPVATQYGENEITKDFNEATFFPNARSVVPAKNPPKNITVQAVASTSSSAWGDRKLEELKQGKATFDKTKDLPGPVPLVVLATIKTAQTPPAKGKVIAAAPAAKTGKLVVAGNSLFAANPYFNQLGNGDLFLNTVNFLTNQTDLITIQRPNVVKPLMLTRSQGLSFMWTVVILMPLAVLVSGIAVFRMRRAQR